MKWLVGRTLDYIDVAVDSFSTVPTDRFSKRDRLKKVFEQEIYGARNSMFRMEADDIRFNAKLIFENLYVKLDKLITISIADMTQRKDFLDLVAIRVDETRKMLLDKI